MNVKQRKFGENPSFLDFKWKNFCILLLRKKYRKLFFTKIIILTISLMHCCKNETSSELIGGNSKSYSVNFTPVVLRQSVPWFWQVAMTQTWIFWNFFWSRHLAAKLISDNFSGLTAVLCRYQDNTSVDYFWQFKNKYMIFIIDNINY